MKIKISQKDIDIGFARNSALCPIALALHRVFGPEKRITVLYNRIEIDGVKYRTNEQIRDFIYAVDNEQPVEPCTIDLELLN